MQKMFFFHIPKCAGMSVWHALWDIYGFENVFQVGTQEQRDELDLMTPEKRLAYGAIGGHGYLPGLSASAGDLSGYFKFVTFRNPVDRIVSEYHFIRNLPEHWWHETVCNMSLLEFASHRNGLNMQTRLMCEEADSKKALAVLDSFFDDWCLMEDLDRLIERLYVAAGQQPKPAGHENKGKGGSRAIEDPTVIAKIEMMNAADMEFYKCLKERASNRADMLCK